MMSKITVAIFIAFAIDGSAFGQSNEAWWLTVRFQPRDATVEGIPIQQIDPSWTAACLLRDAPLPAAASERGYTLQNHGATFERSGDFDRDGREDKVRRSLQNTDRCIRPFLARAVFSSWRRLDEASAIQGAWGGWLQCDLRHTEATGLGNLHGVRLLLRSHSTSRLVETKVRVAIAAA